jgi:hypothetical protein
MDPHAQPPEKGAVMSQFRIQKGFAQTLLF